MVLIDMEMPERCGGRFNCDGNFNDDEKTIENWMCILRVRFVRDHTGDVSVGWWKEKEDEE